ncbi:heat shock protein 90-5 [Forsythia ovata]|uniref:Heat shock protein 90-5 n=1 Tax=Forsythia ovata TaxID=205694 RepID=A0ABD1W9D6_9LAMI
MAQPDSPAKLGNKIYEMMAMALGGSWGRLEDHEGEPTENATESDASSADDLETQVVVPSEDGYESSRSDPIRICPVTITSPNDIKLSLRDVVMVGVVGDSDDASHWRWWKVATGGCMKD